MENLLAVWEGVRGKKTYILAGLAVFVALLGHIFGPIVVNGNVVVPNYTWFNIYQIAINSGLIAALRHGIEGIKAKA